MWLERKREGQGGGNEVTEAAGQMVQGRGVSAGEDSPVPKAVPTHPRISPKTPKHSPHSEARDGSRRRTVDMVGPLCRLGGTPPSSPHSNGWARPTADRQPRRPQDYLQSRFSQQPSGGQLISPQRSSHVGRQGGRGLACSCLLPPCLPRPGSSVRLSQPHQ